MDFARQASSRLRRRRYSFSSNLGSRSALLLLLGIVARAVIFHFQRHVDNEATYAPSRVPPNRLAAREGETLRQARHAVPGHPAGGEDL